MRSLILVSFLVALANCLTIRSKTNISLNNTKTPLSTQQPIPEPHKQDELPVKDNLKFEDFNNASNIVVTAITRVYPQDNEQFYQYEQVLPLEDLISTGPMKVLTLGNETTREGNNNTFISPRANEQTGNTTSVDNEIISENKSHSNPNQSQIQQKQKDTIGIIPIPIFQNNNQTENKTIQEKPQQNGQQKEGNQTKSQGPSENGGEEKENNNNEKRRDQIIEKTVKQKEQVGQNSTQNNKAAEGEKPLPLTNNTNKQNQKQNGSKIIPIVLPFEQGKRNESKVENQTSQEQNKNKSSLVPIIIPGIVPRKDENENKQPIKNNQTNTQNTTQANLIIIPQNNQITHKNTTSVQNISNDTKFNDSSVTLNQQNSTKQTQVLVLPIPIDENNTQNSQKQPKRNQTEIIEQNKRNENSKNQTKIDPIIPIILPITNQKNQTNSTQPNFTHPLIEHNNTSQNNNEIILVPPITSPELVPQNTTPEKQQNSAPVTMVAFSCTQITNQPQRDTCKDLNGCNWLWDEYEERCGKSGGNILAIYGPSTTQIISKQELAHLKWEH